MLRRLLLLTLILAFPATASAAPVLMMDRSGHVSPDDDPFLVEPADQPGAVAAASLARAKRSGGRSMYGELARLLHRRTISNRTYRNYKGRWVSALNTVRRLRGTRRAELQAVINNLHDVAARGDVSRSRLPALFLTLDRNRQWWTQGRLLSSGQRVEFNGSEIVFEYYPGQGLEIQQLASFGKADGLYTGRLYSRMHHLLSELIPLAATRGGGLAWEYYFYFDGGAPPWTSAMSQGAALEALTRAYKAFQSRSYLDLARRALPIFHRRPRVGVSVPARHGVRYLLYSFAPGARVINGFLWSLVGLFDYAQASGSRDASRLFGAGDSEAQAELPSYDTGSWSLYQPGERASLDYHKLVTEFLHDLCDRTHARVYCSTAARFDRYLKHPPSGV